jgi:2-oxoglutarate dehydrogenase E1 component
MQQENMEAQRASSVFAGGNAAYLEQLYELYLQDPTQVDAAWRNYFDSLPKVNGQHEESHAQIKQQFIELSKQHKPIVTVSDAGFEHERKQIQVLRLINAYRLQGHLHAQIDPLAIRAVADENETELTLEDHGLSKDDLKTIFDCETFVGPKNMELGELYKALNETYCGSIGTEFMHIPSPEEREWIQHRIEGARAKANFNTQQKRRILERLTAAEGLEQYLGKKYPGAKRFSLEGIDALIPLLDEIIQRSSDSHSVREMVVGMAHRGRLNVLINILGKNSSDLFDEFEGRNKIELESGDVKYHMGFSSDVQTDNGSVHLALAFNPSHLEIVTPVVAGSVRARQTRLQDTNPNKVLPIALHGDSAFSGQGVVMETLNMSQTRGYGIGGTIHIVTNNQVGFTTSNPKDMRSTIYCTDVAKVVLAPIFHVNADDPEAVVFVAQMAIDYRMKFNKDVVIDLVGYRRHGHNEADDPTATQPFMYSKIKNHDTVRKIYAKSCNAEQSIMLDESKQMVKDNRARLDNGECVACNIVSGLKLPHAIDWSLYFSSDWREPAKTAVTTDKFSELSKVLLDVPGDFPVHPRVNKIYQDRALMAEGKLPIDWGFAETLAYASLLDENVNVRISGQDSGRGTFFHRHAVLHHQETGENFIPLKNINPKMPFLVIDSLLSEEAVLGFEYGYSTTDPSVLVIWEAQFGDFANGAQVVIDQFISSGQHKWGRLCGLVMLLPHGYEGQGPEHSSARLERYLQLCAEHNIQVCVPSNASQVFHMLRRQMLRKIRIPLVVMSPKSLLRHKDAACSIEDLTKGHFQVIIPETDEHNANDITKIVLCSGKVYYELLHERREKNKKNVVIMRIEQLYPFPEIELKEFLAQYPNAKEVVWCQEEPKNQGAWFPIQHHFRACLNEDQNLIYAGREASASPAVGYLSKHKQQQQALVEDALK